VYLKQIFSAQSVVFRTMLKNENMIEKTAGVIKMTDVSVEAVDQFLNFLYCGKLKNDSKDETVEPTWVKILPELVYIAQKVTNCSLDFKAHMLISRISLFAV